MHVSPGERKGYPLQYSGLETSMACIVHGVAKSLTGLSDFHFHIHISILLQFFFFFHLGCYTMLNRVPYLYNRSLLVIHFKYCCV